MPTDTNTSVSDFDKIEKGICTFFGAFKSEVGKLFKHAPAWDAAAISTITYVAPLVETAVALADPAAAPAVASIVTKVESALTSAQVVLKAGQTSSPSLITYLQAVNDNIDQVEAAAQIKDPATAAKLTAIVGTITAEISAIIGEIQAAKQVGPQS